MSINEYSNNASIVADGPVTGARDIGVGIATWLKLRQLKSGGIQGDDGKESSTEHYAHAFAALAIAHLAEAEQSEDGWQRVERAVGFSLSIPAAARSLQEFNSLALILLWELAEASSAAPASLKSTLRSVLNAPAFLYDGSRMVSNNWLAMRAVCHIKLGQIKGDPALLARGQALVREALTWQLDDGVFVDYPRYNRSNFATPLTYHVKICAMFTLIIQGQGTGDQALDTRLKSALVRGLDAVVGLTAPTGECLYFGRSCNSLFGAAAAYYALSTMGARMESHAYLHAAGRIIHSLISRREPDGHLRLTPGHVEADRSGWDVYYFTEVYNAYAAAMLFAAPEATPISEHNSYSFVTTPGESANKKYLLHQLPNAGLIAVEASGFFVAFSTRGQCVPEGSSLFCDMRYSGLQPLYLYCNGMEQISEPPLWWRGTDTKAKAVDPSVIGFCPQILWRGRRYCARVFDHLCLSEDNETILLGGKGSAMALTLPGKPMRLLRRVRGKLTGRGDLAFTPHTLAGVTINRYVVVLPSRNTLIFVDGYSGRLPSGAIWIGPDARHMANASIRIYDAVGGSPLQERLVAVPTSLGEAVYYSHSGETDSISITICSTEKQDFHATVIDNRVHIQIDETSLCLNLQTEQIQ